MPKTPTERVRVNDYVVTSEWIQGTRQPDKIYFHLSLDHFADQKLDREINGISLCLRDLYSFSLFANLSSYVSYKLKTQQKLKALQGFQIQILPVINQPLRKIHLFGKQSLYNDITLNKSWNFKSPFHLECIKKGKYSVKLSVFQLF